MNPRPLVSVVDDDESVRESLPDLLEELGFAARPFASAEEFLASAWVDRTQCLVLDVAKERIATVVWATGFRPDYSWLEAPTLDAKGRLRHEGGVAAAPIRCGRTPAYARVNEP